MIESVKSKVVIVFGDDARIDTRVKAIINMGKDEFNFILIHWSKSDEPLDNVVTFPFKFPRFRRLGVFNFLPKILFQFFVVFKLFAIKNIRIIHILNSDIALLSIFYSKIAKKIVILDLLDYLSETLITLPNSVLKIFKITEDFTIKLAHNIVLVDENRMSQISHIKGISTTIVNNVAEYSSIVDSDAKESDLIYVGVLNSDRGIEKLINLAKNNLSIQLVIAGRKSGFDTKTVENCQNINYLGEINYEYAINLIRRTKIMVAIYDPSVLNNRKSNTTTTTSTSRVATRTTPRECGT